MINDRVERVFSLFLYLTFNKNKDVKALAKMFGCNKSSIYRYIDLYQALGFGVQAEYGSVYKVVSFPKEFQKLFVIPEDGEVPCWMKGLQMKESGDNKAYEMLTEFRKNCPFTKSPYLMRYTANANKLIQACKEKKVVILHQYENTETGGCCDRKVEPYDFGWYFNFVWAYDTRSMKNELFRVTQISEVEILDQEWTEEKRHKKQKMDVFGTSGHTTRNVRMRISMRVKNKLTSEHPMTNRAVKRIGQSTFWEFEAEVCSYRELARFFHGFMDEVEILEGDGLEDYIIGYLEEQLRMAREMRAHRQIRNKMIASIQERPAESIGYVGRIKMGRRVKSSESRQTA